MVQHWLLRIGDAENFINSSKYNLWGVKSDTPCVKKILSDIKEGDILWFIKSKSQGLVFAVAEFAKIKKRELGPLISLSLTNKELGWNDTEFANSGNHNNWDYEIHYINLLNLADCDILTKIKGPLTIRKFNPDKVNVDLILEYKYIKKYSKIKNIL
jgi:hypothetical protein